MKGSGKFRRFLLFDWVRDDRITIAGSDDSVFFVQNLEDLKVFKQEDLKWVGEYKTEKDVNEFKDYNQERMASEWNAEWRWVNNRVSHHDKSLFVHYFFFFKHSCDSFSPTLSFWKSDKICYKYDHLEYIRDIRRCLHKYV